MNGSLQSIDLSLSIAASPADVYKALTEADELMKWFPTIAESEPVAGGRYMYAWPNEGDASTYHYSAGEYLETVPNEKVRFGWYYQPVDDLETARQRAAEPPPTEVTLTVTAEAGGTRLALRHVGWGADPEMQALRERHVAGWTYFTGNLKSFLEEGRDQRGAA